MLSKWSVYDEKILEIVNNSEFQLKKIDIIKRINDNLSKNEKNHFSKYLQRHLKRICDNHEGIYNATNNLDVANANVKHLWLKNKESSLLC
jgi:hypothetical protein